MRRLDRASGLLPSVALIACLACAASASAQQSRTDTARTRISAMGGPRLVGVDFELKLTDRLVLSGGPSVHTHHTQVGLSNRVGLDTYIAGQAFNGLFVRMETAAVLTIESDTSIRDIGFTGSILLGSTWTAPAGVSTGITIGGQTFFVPGRVQRIQLDVSIRLSFGWAF